MAESQDSSIDLPRLDLKDNVIIAQLDLDEGLEEDPFQEDTELFFEEDPQGDDEDSFLEEDFLELPDDELVGDSMKAEVEEESFPIQVSIRNLFQSALGYSDTQKGGVGKENESNRERKNYLVNAFQLDARLQISPFHYYQLRTLNRFTQKYDHESAQYTDDFELEIREGYFNGISGNHRYTIGAQILRLGKVDYDSPIDILCAKSSTATDILDLDEVKIPIVGLKYDWLGESQGLSLYLAPFKQKTAGTEYTIFQEEERVKETGDDPADRSVTRPHFGIQYQTGGQVSDFRFGLFQWFDPDNKISWQDSSTPSANNSQTYTEEDTTISFLSFEMDMSLGSYILKTDVGVFGKKNFYHFYKQSDGSSEFNTVTVPHAAIAVSLEKKLESLFIMPVYSYRFLKDVPAQTHIFMFENEVGPLNKVRSIDRHQISLVGVYEFSQKFNTMFTLATTAPFRRDSVTSVWNWSLGGGDHELALKLFWSQTEKLKQTEKQIVLSKAFVTYASRF